MKKVASRTRSAKKTKPIPYQPSPEAERLLKRVEQIAEALDIPEKDRPRHVVALQRILDQRTMKAAAVAMVGDTLKPRAILALERMPEDDEIGITRWLAIVREVQNHSFTLPHEVAS